MKRYFVLALAVAVSLAGAQAPWPMERQDRWGSGRAIMGPDPSTLTTPWISNKLAFNMGPVSHGASLGPNGVGYFGNWVDNKLYKFDYNSGAILGSFSTLNFVAAVPAIGTGNNVFVSTDSPNGRVFGIDSSIMDFNWFRTTGYVGGSPILGPDESVIFSTGNGGAYRVHPISGLNIWERTGLGAGRGCAFTRDDSKVLVSNGNSLTALNYADGTTAWTVGLGSGTSAPATAPSGTVVVGTESGFIYGINPANGSILWTKQALDKVTGAAAFSQDGTVAYVCSVDHRLYAFRVSDGVRLWSFTGNAWNERAPSVGFDGRIYFHNKNSDLYCVNPDGTLSWMVHLNGEARGPLTIGPDGTLYVGFTGSQTGLAMVRQQALSLANQSVTVERGTLMDGNLSSIETSDDVSYRAQQAFDVDRSEKPLRIVATATTGVLPLSKVKVTVESKINAQAINQYLELFNYATGTWTQIDVREGSQVDETISVDVPNASQFASASGQVKVRISWKPNGSGPGNRLVGSIDYLRIDVVPQFTP